MREHWIERQPSIFEKFAEASNMILRTNKLPPDRAIRPHRAGSLMRRLPARAGSILSLLLLSLIAGPAVKAELDPLSLPLISISDFEYRGAFRVPADTGSPVSNMQYAVGPIAYNPDNHSIFMVGHAHHQAVVEFAVPDGLLPPATGI